MDLSKIMVANMIASAGSGQPKVGSDVFFSCQLAGIPNKPGLEFQAQTHAFQWGWIDINNHLTRKGFERIKE